MPAGTMTGVRGASLELGPALAGVIPPLSGAVSREAWPELSLRDDDVPLARAVVERRQASAPDSGRAAQAAFSVARPARRLRAGHDIASAGVPLPLLSEAS